MKLSVRLNAKEEQIVRGLKRRRINVSALVRKSIVEAGEKEASRSDAKLLDKIIADNPAPPPGRSDRRPPLNDRRAVQEFIRRRLQRK